MLHIVPLLNYNSVAVVVGRTIRMGFCSVKPRMEKNLKNPSR